MALTNAQYDTIMRQYNQKQFKSQHLYHERLKEVYQLDEAFQAIDHEISSLSIARGRSLVSGSESALEGLKEEIERLSSLRRSLLKKHGLSEDYLMPQYECHDCCDTGYVDNQKCHCFKKASIDLLYTQSNLTEILKDENFRNFSFKYYGKHIINPVTGQNAMDTAKQAVLACKKFILEFDDSYENILLYGDTGVGKTFLTNCIAGELLNTCHSVIYFTSFELFELFARHTFSKDTMTNDIYDYIFESDLLIIDDLGTELTNSFVSSQLFLCINERHLRKKSTIISTNLPLDILRETYSERAFSRIVSSYTILNLIGDDIRIQKKLTVKST